MQVSACWGLLALVVAALSAASVTSSSVCDVDACSCAGAGHVHCDCRRSDTKEVNLAAKPDDKTGKAEKNSSATYIPEIISVVRIEHCDMVRIGERAFAHAAALRQVNLTGIGQLQLAEQAFNWHHNIEIEEGQQAGLAVDISNTYLPLIPSYALKGTILTIRLYNVSVDTVQPFAFASLVDTERIDVVDSKVKNFEGQAFKKFSLQRLTFSGCDLPALPSRSFVDLEVRGELRFEQVHFDSIRTLAVKVRGTQQFTMMGCHVGRMEKESISLRTEGRVTIRNNVFNTVMADSLRGMTVEALNLSHDGKQDFNFLNNSVSFFEQGAFTFNTSEFTPKLGDITFLHPHCSCQNSDTLSHAILYTSADGLKRPPLDATSFIFCQESPARFVSVKQFNKSNCQEMFVKRYLLVIVFFLTVVVACSGTFYYICRSRVKRYIDVPNNSADGKVSFKAGTKLPIMVVPDGRTYRETELHVIDEQVEPIVEYIPPHGAKN
ncbi:hypothetical protein LSTR_LSTR001785 [Laodelphax striatellus]|uniref:Uncharacterized protein n=1 Tax=Laodelphax striatellus TaxID=195883 RepID=A0A482WGL6_LAOST|nr:hypothetical protein LSTR_LSTR001785 [Laodelphax striatellus]